MSSRNSKGLREVARILRPGVSEGLRLSRTSDRKVEGVFLSILRQLDTLDLLLKAEEEEAEKLSKSPSPRRLS